MDTRLGRSHGHLLHANQFIIGPRSIDHFDGWVRYAHGDNWQITAHPSLNVLQVDNEHGRMTLIGFILDPRNPAFTDENIMSFLLAQGRDENSLIKACDGYGGRWVIVASIGTQTFLFHDALGLRQVFYSYDQQQRELWLFSQPGLAAQVLHLPKDKAALDFIDSYEFRRYPESNWPVTATAFSGLHHLLPNHKLDMDTALCQRYWPDEFLPTVSLEQALSRIKPLLTGLVEAASNRFELVLSITAGLDSRVVMAASKNVSNRLQFATVRQSRMADNHMDITIPRNLLKSLNFKHNVIKAVPDTSPEFSAQFRRSVFLAHEHYAPDAEAIFNYYSRTKVAMTGSGGEVARCFYREHLTEKNQVITAQVLAQIERMGNNTFAMQHYSRWLERRNEFCNVHPIDLFEWENGCGNWLAMTQMEFDIAWRDIFTPYNCRELLTILLGVNERYRCLPKSIFFNRLIMELWSDVLSEPINPGQGKSKGRLQLVKGAVKAFLKRKCKDEVPTKVG